MHALSHITVVWCVGEPAGVQCTNTTVYLPYTGSSVCSSTGIHTTTHRLDWNDDILPWVSGHNIEILLNKCKYDCERRIFIVICSWYTQGQVFEGICSTFSYQGYHYSLLVHVQIHCWHQFCVPQLCRHSTWICEWTMLFHTYTLHVVTHYGTVCQLHVIPWKHWMRSTLQLRWCLVINLVWPNWCT